MIYNPKWNQRDVDESLKAAVVSGSCGFAAPYCRAQEGAGQDAALPAVRTTLKDEIVRLTSVQASAKIRSAPR